MIDRPSAGEKGPEYRLCGWLGVTKVVPCLLYPTSAFIHIGNQKNSFHKPLLDTIAPACFTCLELC